MYLFIDSAERERERERSVFVDLSTCKSISLFHNSSPLLQMEINENIEEKSGQSPRYHLIVTQSLADRRDRRDIRGKSQWLEIRTETVGITTLA